MCVCDYFFFSLGVYTLFISFFFFPRAVRREFVVTVDGATRKKLKVDGQVRLLVETGHITLISMDNNRITRFGIEHLRRLGYTDDNFHIEAGRRSESGEGDYTFLTTMVIKWLKKATNQITHVIYMKIIINLNQGSRGAGKK